MRTLFETLSNGLQYAKVVGRNTYGEYVVKHYGRQVIGPDATYYTDDLEDACNTAIVMTFGVCKGMPQ